MATIVKAVVEDMVAVFIIALILFVIVVTTWGEVIMKD